MKKKVLMAMSGGVDSSLAAALLLQQGYDVIGVTMQIWQNDNPEVVEREGGCCSLSAVDDARRVANTLGIPYYVMNFRELFQEKVIDYFTAEYIKGRTPNPCIACNRYIKFEALLGKALAMGADFVATGHYARLGYDDKSGRYVMQKGVDERKDQTYALYNLTQDQLAHTLMPLGGYTKDQTRELARQYKLTVAEKPDSQEICFVLDNDYKGFITSKAGKDIKPGPFLDTKGNVLGQHEGIAYYTVGQRKGLGIAFGEPMFVVDIDYASNAVILGKAEEVFSSGLIASDNNWIYISGLKGSMEVEVKIRYSAKPAKATIKELANGLVEVQFAEPQRAVTPGQAVVYYLGDYVVGGGTIEKKL